MNLDSELIRKSDMDGFKKGLEQLFPLNWVLRILSLQRCRLSFRGRLHTLASEGEYAMYEYLSSRTGPTIWRASYLFSHGWSELA